MPKTMENIPYSNYHRNGLRKKKSERALGMGKNNRKWTIFLKNFFLYEPGLHIPVKEKRISRWGWKIKRRLIQYSFVNSCGICSQIFLWYGRYFPVPRRMISSLSDQHRLKARPALKSMMILGLPCKMDPEGKMPYSVSQLKFSHSWLTEAHISACKALASVALPMTPIWLPHIVETTFMTKECNVLLSCMQKNSYFCWWFKDLMRKSEFQSPGQDREGRKRELKA